MNNAQLQLLVIHSSYQYTATKQGGHTGSKQDRLKWQHVRHKNSRSCHSMGGGGVVPNIKTPL